MTSYGPDAKDDDILSDAKEAFKEAADAESENRERGLEDLRFARLGQQWPDEIARQRQEEGRPMLSVPRLQTFMRQVVNDARQNKPSIKVHPVDSGADPETAEIYNGILRHIQNNSGADIAYDNGVEHAVSIGFGYWRIGLDYATDDTFDLDLKIEPVYDPFTVYGDPWATSADGSDWMSAFIVERMSHKRFEAEYPDATPVSWSADGQHDPHWTTNEWVQVAEYWVREKVAREIIAMSDGSVLDVERLKDQDILEQLAISGVTPVDGQTRTVASYKVKQCILNDTEVLSKRDDWPGKYIPIVPVYGDTVNEEGKRHHLSLIHFAKDSQRQLNYWRTAATELVALAPRVPYIGPEDAFEADPEKWATANVRSWPFIAYKKNASGPPQRQPMDSSAFGAIQQAMAASDDMKGVLGQFDASLGAQSNETSGRAIMARQREGDTSTFHFIDNLTRSIRHSGRILIDLIPHVWTGPRIARLMGEDGSVSEQPVNQPIPQMDEQGRPMMEQDPLTGQPRPLMRVYDLTAGKYDLTASAGPSYTTKREEAANQMIELIRAYPAAAPVIGDLLASNLDWPGADEIAKRLKAMLPPQIEQGIPPEIQQQIQEGMQTIQKLTAENETLKADRSVEALKVEVEKAQLQLEQQKIAIQKFEAETDRMKVQGELQIKAAEPKIPAQSNGAMR